MNVYPVRLNGASVILREISPDDVPAIFVHASDPRVTEYLEWEPHESIETTSNLVQLWIDHALAQNRTDYELAIEKNGTLIGTAGLAIDKHHSHRAEIGYVVNPLWWDQGVATGAVRLLVEFGFRNLDLHRIWACVDPANHSSCRVLEKAGMTYEGCLRDDVIVAGDFKNSSIYATIAATR